MDGLRLESGVGLEEDEPEGHHQHQQQKDGAHFLGLVDGLVAVAAAVANFGKVQPARHRLHRTGRGAE